MKLKLIILFSLFFIVNNFGQSSTGDMSRNYSRYVFKIGTNNAVSSNLHDNSGGYGYYVGKYYDRIYRQLFQWSLPDNVIPDGAQIILDTHVLIQVMKYVI